MLEKIQYVNIAEETDKEVYKAQTAQQKEKMALLGQRIREAKIPVIILFDGWGASGKGTLIGKTINCLDPRSFKTFSTVAATEQEKRMPLMWRFWNMVPEKGKLSILDRSWYQEYVPAGIEEELSEEEKLSRLDRFNLFERQLTDDGCLIIKFFLHITQEEQKRRFKKLLDNNDTNWRVTGLDLKRNRRYDKYFVEYDKMLEYTNTESAPWTVIDASDKRRAVLSVFSTMIKAIEDRLDGRPAGYGESGKRHIRGEIFSIATKPPLALVPLDKTIEESVYETELKQQQKRLSQLHSRLYERKLPVVIAFEGWDAAGKGGTIRRVSAALDPRGYEAVPIAAPELHELNRQYLWRFWQNLPKSGHVAIFDRTWYGRVLVERLENLTPEKRWRQAYNEINEFENELYDGRMLILKFWLHIDKDEQLRRFNDRMSTPEKQWKITDEDWRNRDKWDQYEAAINEMLQKTSTDFAPWHIIENNDKKYGRIRTLKIINDAIEMWLEKHS